jgi:YesN/AraC family two-component response regulator
MITTHNTMNDVAAAMSLGIDDYLMKPIDEATVINRLQLLGISRTLKHSFSVHHAQDPSPRRR